MNMIMVNTGSLMILNTVLKKKKEKGGKKWTG